MKFLWNVLSDPNIKDPFWSFNVCALTRTCKVVDIIGCNIKWDFFRIWRCWWPLCFDTERLNHHSNMSFMLWPLIWNQSFQLFYYYWSQEYILLLHQNILHFIFNRIRRSCSKYKIREELTIVEQCLCDNGYPQNLITIYGRLK